MLVVCGTTPSKAIKLKSNTVTVEVQIHFETSLAIDQTTIFIYTEMTVKWIIFCSRTFLVGPFFAGHALDPTFSAPRVSQHFGKIQTCRVIWVAMCHYWLLARCCGLFGGIFSCPFVEVLASPKVATMTAICFVCVTFIFPCMAF